MTHNLELTMIDRYHAEPVYDVLLQRCADCGEVFDLDDHAEEDDDE